MMLSGRRTSSGRRLLSRSSLACLRDGGKYMASDLDLVESDSRCRIRLKRVKCLLSWIKRRIEEERSSFRIRVLA